MSLPKPLALLRRRLGLAPAAHPASPDGSDGHGTEALSAERLTLLERSIWSLVWLGVLVGGLNLWGSWSSWPVIDALAPSLVAVALVGFVICWCSPSPRSWIHQGLAMASALVVVVAPQVVNIHTRIYYATDSAALDHVAARVLVHGGHNPYATSLSSAALLLKTPAYFWTYTLTGGHVGSVSYPAGSFLVYAPAFALGFHHEVVDWMDLYFWIASALLVFFLVPRFLRWIAVLLALTGIFVGLFSGGGTDATFLPFVILAVWRWDRFSRKGAGLAGWMGPVALGLACAIKQTPWFIVPFLVIGIWIETRRDGRSPAPVVVRYVLIVVGVFAAVNLPFIIWGADQWWHGTLLPLSQPLVADGQGIVSLALHGLTGGANLSLLMDASALALLAVLVAFVAWFGPLKRIWLLVLPATFFFSPRSFTGYLIDFFPAALVALLTVEAARAPIAARRWGRFRPSQIAVGALALATGVVTAISLTNAPLALTYRSSDIGPSQQHMFAVTVTATNNTDATLTPHFMVDLGAAHPTGFWTVAHGRPVVIGPHQSVTVTLFPPTGTAAYLPPWAADYVIDAYTASPRALSTTNDIWHNYIPKLSTP